MPPSVLSTEEERLWRAFKLGQNCGYSERFLGLSEIMPFVMTDAALERAIEPREMMLARHLDDERRAVRKLREEVRELRNG